MRPPITLRLGLAAAVLSALAGCAPSLADGTYGCNDDGECPSGWSCRADRLCYREADSPPPPGDAGTDGARDAATDTVPDVAEDTGPGGELCNERDDDGDLFIDEDFDLRTDPANCGACGIVCPSGSCTDSVCDSCTETPGAVDLLFMVDNSNSMAEEQVALATAFPTLVTALITGEVEDGSGRFLRFVPVTSLRVGVVTSDMGTGGFSVPSCAVPERGDDGLLRVSGNTSIPGCDALYPKWLDFEPGGTESPDAFAASFGCVARAGTSGCGFEQPLDSVLKAITPSTSSVRFSQGTVGHGDGSNGGFLRDEALLAVVLVTDEDDCSVADPELLNPTSTTFSGDLNLRCFQYPDSLHPLSRYVDGLLDLKAPRDLVFAAITGIPAGLEATTAEEYAALLADPRMEARVDAAMPTRLVPACTTDEGVAFPARRIAGLGMAFDDRGVATTTQSICQADFAPAVTSIVRAIARRLATSCGP